MIADYNTISAPTAGNDGALDEAIRDLIGRVLPAHAVIGIRFDELRFEIWEDSGRVIAFPALRRLTRRIDMAGVQVVAPDIAEEVARLDHSRLSDHKYTTQLRTLIGKVATRVHAAAARLLSIPYGVYYRDGAEITEQIAGDEPPLSVSFLTRLDL